jgi:hypothetical protein
LSPIPTKPVEQDLTDACVAGAKLVTVWAVHTLLFLAVEADDETEAIESVESWLEEVELGDWWEIGGRWAGALGGPCALRASDDRAVFDKAIERMLTLRLQRVNELRQVLAGADPEVEVYNPFGFEVSDTDAARARVHANYNSSAETFSRLLAGRSLPGEEFRFLGYQLRVLGTLLAGYPSLEAGVFDISAHTSSLDDLYSRLDEQPANQWLVIADVHT